MTDKPRWTPATGMSFDLLESDPAYWRGRAAARRLAAESLMADGDHKAADECWHMANEYEEQAEAFEIACAEVARGDAS